MSDRIYSGKDRAKELGFKDYRAMVKELSKRIGLAWDESMDEAPENALTAFITGGRWAVTCECGESYYAEPSDPFGYCYGKCGNVTLNGKGRRVNFPTDHERFLIESVLLERQLEGQPNVISRLGTQGALAVNLIRPKDAPRNWDGQSIDELRVEHVKIREIMEEIKKQEPEEVQEPLTMQNVIERAQLILDEIKEESAPVITGDVEVINGENSVADSPLGG